MGSAVSSISNSVGSGVKMISNPSATIGNPIGSIGQQMQNVGNVAGNLPGTAIGGNLLSGAGKMINPGQPTQPSAPGTDPGAAAALAQQQQQAQQFNQNLPDMQNKAGQQLGQATNQQLGTNLNQTRAFDNSRGLLFGGINQGNEQQQRVNAATSLAQGRESINDQYQNAANQMNAAAIGSGVAIQQSQQGIQDQIYNQALTNMMNQNQAFGSLMGAGGMAAGMML